MSTNGQITIFDIANEAGVSIATVSRVISDSQNVRAATRERVMEVIRKYNFKPNVVARGLHQGRTNTFAIVLPEITNPFYANLFNAADMEAREHGYALLLNCVEDNEHANRALLDQLIERRLDGVLLAGGITETPTPEIVRLLIHLQQYMPLAIFSEPIDNVNCMYFTTDWAESASQSVRHLNALGHRRIALLGGRNDSHNFTSREAGFYGEVARLGLNRSQFFRQEAGYTPDAGAVGALRLLSGMPKAEWPTAIIAINDLVALGALRQLEKMGISVPRDMAMIGCDNQFFSPYTNPPLTTVDLHEGKQARLAIQYLLDAQEGGSTPFTHIQDSTFIVRESCGERLWAAPKDASGTKKGMHPDGQA